MINAQVLIAALNEAENILLGINIVWVRSVKDRQLDNILKRNKHYEVLVRNLNVAIIYTQCDEDCLIFIVT